MWRSEKDFGKYIMQRLKAKGMTAYRVETGMTTVGMPDLYAMGGGDDYFIEFKNMPKASIAKGKWKIPWREGQQMWAAEYRRTHMTSARTKCTFTFVGMSDGVLLLRMGSLFEGNYAEEGHPDVWTFALSEFGKLDLYAWLRQNVYKHVS